MGTSTARNVYNEHILAVDRDQLRLHGERGLDLLDRVSESLSRAMGVADLDK